MNGFPRGVVQNDYKTWEPRIGFAYNFRGDGKTVLRGGYGVFYERVQGNDVYNAALNPPFAYQPSATNVYFSNPSTSALTGATTTQSFPSVLTNINYHYPSPGTENLQLRDSARAGALGRRGCSVCRFRWLVPGRRPRRQHAAARQS